VPRSLRRTGDRRSTVPWRPGDQHMIKRTGGG
jgi:hypothetical protein